MPADDNQTSSLTAALGNVRPGSDALAREQARARLVAALFGDPVEPVQVGRFLLLERLGHGGMGVVYSAYDPKLDRRVALKLLHARAAHDSRGHARLANEARALARLSHPNVVPVHDVGIIDDKVFLVMELVAGQTLRVWAGQTRRSWRDVLAVYLQAGRGLAAAHAVGIIHRDFKPDNALVGDDGRVRVVDFGLARHRPGEETPAQEDRHGATPASPPGQAGEPAPTAPLQSGTPAYMAPEQFAGAAVGPAADQFSFCVALYEALYQQKPFECASVAELAASMRAGRLREPPKDSRVPAWVHAALRRGLAPDPGARHDTMDALLAELSRDLDRTRHRRLLALGVAALVAAAIYSFARGHAGVEVCQGGPAELARVWDQTRRDRVARALRDTGRPYADAISPRVLGGLDRYGAAWTGMRHEACMSHQRGEQSSDLLDRRMRCLDGRLRALDEALAVLEEIDAGSLGQMVQIVEGLPSIAYCADREALAAEVPPPDDASLASRVEELRSRLRRVEARCRHREPPCPRPARAPGGPEARAATPAVRGTAGG